jgi:hypothetical protein
LYDKLFPAVQISDGGKKTYSSLSMAWFKGKSKGNQSWFLPMFFLETQIILSIFSERKSG